MSPGAHALASLADDPALRQARRARDWSDVEALRGAADTVRSEAPNRKSFEAYLRLALREDWMFEAAYDYHDNELVKQAARPGIVVAREAVKLNPNSSDAHWLLSKLLGELIPCVLGGSRAWDLSPPAQSRGRIALSPNNVHAYMARALDYFLTPSLFDGRKTKVVVVRPRFGLRRTLPASCWHRPTMAWPTRLCPD